MSRVPIVDLDETQRAHPRRSRAGSVLVALAPLAVVALLVPIVIALASWRVTPPAAVQQSTPQPTPAVLVSRRPEWSAPTLVKSADPGGRLLASALSSDGLSLYFSFPWFPGALVSRDADIYVMHRPMVGAAWGAPIKLPPSVNSDDDDLLAAVSRDGHWLFFESVRPGGIGRSDIYMSWRADVNSDDAWLPATNLTTVNSPAADGGPTLFEDPTTGAAALYFTSDRASPMPYEYAGQDIYVSVRNADGSFGVPSLVPELNSFSGEGQPRVSGDGLELMLVSYRSGTWDLWVAKRKTTLDLWSTPENLTELNTLWDDYGPVLSWDGSTLLFGSARGGNGDLYESVRIQHKRMRPY